MYHKIVRLGEFKAAKGNVQKRGYDGNVYISTALLM